MLSPPDGDAVYVSMADCVKGCVAVTSAVYVGPGLEDARIVFVTEAGPVGEASCV
jgi:hypothetical protein